MRDPGAADAQRVLIVNADDFGLTPGVCEGILRAHEQGVVTSTSALTVGPAWERYAAALASSGMGVGAHLCVVGEDPPLLSAAEVPTLVDARGRFPLTWPTFVARSAMGRVDTDDLRRELGAQLQRVAGSGVRLTHVDSHQNLHHFPQVAKVLFELASAHGVGAARVARSRGWTPGRLGLRVLSERFDRLARRHGVVTPEAAVGLDEAGSLDRAGLAAAIDRLGATGAVTAELCSHPGLADDPARTRYAGWGYHWGDELDALLDPSMPSRVAAAGFVLGDFGDLVAGARSARGSGAAG